MTKTRDRSRFRRERIRSAAILTFSIAVLIVLSGTSVSPGHMFGEPPDARVLIHPREIQPPDHFAGKSFVPVTPRLISPEYRPPSIGLYTGTERIPAFFPDGCDTLRIPDLRLPGDVLPKERESEPIPSLSRAPDNRIYLKEEMVSLPDLDTGKPGGLVRWKDRAKGKMEGFLQIPTVWAEDLVLSYEIQGSGWYVRKPIQAGAAIHLVEAIRRYTGIPAAAGRHFFFSSPRIFEMPFLFLGAGQQFELTETERRNLGEYLRNGGFLYLDNSAPATEWGPGEASLKQMLRDALGSDARFQPILRSHPLYHCFFDFTDGPPNGMEIDGFNWPDASRSCGIDYTHVKMTEPAPYLEGVFLDGELVAVFSNKGYIQKWNTQSDRNEPQLKMGVNLVVYALTREGGMNAREMARYADLP